MKTTTATKVCTRCQQEKPIEDFPMRRAKGRQPVHHWWCRPCKSAYHKEYWAAHPERNLQAILKRYDLTEWDYEQFLEEQDGCCAICRQPPPEGKRLCLDHCHEDGANRGLVCNNCNAILGMSGDDPVVLRRAAQYLEDRR